MTAPDVDVPPQDPDDERDVPLTTDPEEQVDLPADDPNAGEGGSG